MGMLVCLSIVPTGATPDLDSWAIGRLSSRLRTRLVTPSNARFRRVQVYTLSDCFLFVQTTREAVLVLVRNMQNLSLHL